MGHMIMVRNLHLALVMVFLLGNSLNAQEAENTVAAEAKPASKKQEAPKKIEANYRLPYERPIGFSLNFGGISSMTFEGRFLLGLFHNVSLVVSPSYQNTPELPIYHPEKKQWGLFDIRRFNTGIGIRGHFYEYDSWDGLFIEGMARGGMTWIGTDPYMWSVIPSLIFGYAAVYKSGYTVSFGVGLEWEFLLGQPTGKQAEFMKTAYFGVTKIPLTGELSIGWTW